MLLTGSESSRMREALLYVFFTIRHPVEGFWELKFRKTGALPASLLILALFVFTTVVRLQTTSFMYNFVDPRKVDLIRQIAVVLFLIGGWVGVNWSITTLMQGEGKARHIWIVTVYALAPAVLLTPIQIVLSHILSLDESAFYYAIDTISIAWGGILLVSGLMTVHDYSLGKTLRTMLYTVLGLVAAVFIGLMFFTIFEQFTRFVYNAYLEVRFRM